MSKLAVYLSFILITAAARAQTSIPSPTTPQPGASSLSFTNRSGQSFSVDQLASQLRNLRSDVDHSLPLITAFNESYPATAAGNSSLGGKLSSLISGATGQNSSQNSQMSPTLSNVVAGLRGLVSTNSAAATFNPNTLHDLVTLQDHLQAIAPILQELNMGAATGTSPGSQVISSSPNGRYGATNESSHPPTPTGR
jgi:hypothetical protein